MLLNLYSLVVQLTTRLWVLDLHNLLNQYSKGICRDNEQRALESLKKEVDDPLDIPSSWVVGKDCCEWEGVVCNNLTRCVIELHISYLRINNLEWLSSLLSLENLEMYHVDLCEATNWLHVINMLPSLVDLSSSRFNSPIPKWVSTFPILFLLI
ncbi:receptor-like protein 12 isoform X4 [Solanum tuberosum]|uniref:receptor-like protein 12 isoform X4 n=1 Tax=Solanum tuberosum TaxID=4113 RepID=UPI00073A0966|nr:PREDICTED: receptor-like protein 12 isoform X4 [Solanum tuberosum]